MQQYVIRNAMAEKNDNHDRCVAKECSIVAVGVAPKQYVEETIYVHQNEII